MALNTNIMIVNPSSNTILLDNTFVPMVGDTLLMAQISYGTQMSALWQIVKVPGGNQIVLQSNPALCLDINAQSASEVINDTPLTLSLTAGPGNFPNSNLWNVGSFLSSVSQIQSMGANDFVLDAGNNPASKVYQDANNNWQNWQCVEIQ